MGAGPACPVETAVRLVLAHERSYDSWNLEIRLFAVSLDFHDETGRCRAGS